MGRPKVERSDPGKHRGAKPSRVGGRLNSCTSAGSWVRALFSTLNHNAHGCNYTYNVRVEYGFVPAHKLVMSVRPLQGANRILWVPIASL